LVYSAVDLIRYHATVWKKWESALDKCEIVVAFTSCATGEANQIAVELKDRITRIVTARGLSGSIEVLVLKDDENHQDFGASLAIVLGTPAAIALARGVHDLIAARGRSVVIKTKGGHIVAQGGAAKNIDVAETVRALESLEHS
jgi:hypothetical protein